MSTCLVPYSNAWRERLTEKRTGTSLCGWCIGPPGASRPHKFGIAVNKCGCGCHRKGRRIEASDKVAAFMAGGGYGSEEVPNGETETTGNEGSAPSTPSGLGYPRGVD